MVLRYSKIPEGTTELLPCCERGNKKRLIKITDERYSRMLEAIATLKRGSHCPQGWEGNVKGSIPNRMLFFAAFNSSKIFNHYII